MARTSLFDGWAKHSQVICGAYMTVTLVSIHAMDPRGTKVGGMETHVRQLLRRHPADMRILMVGVDDRGDLRLGEPVEIEISGRIIDFVPILRISDDEQRGAARSIASSLTFRFAKALLAHLGTLRRLVAGKPACAEVERFEFAPLARALGVPLVVMVHNEGTRGDKMDSILSRHWWVHDIAEWLAFRLAARIFCVTPKLKERLGERHPSQAKKAEVLTVSVDTDLFKASPFQRVEAGLKLVYAGRLDEFKDPPLMFSVARRLHERLGGAFEFHYCGASDPHRFVEFAAIEPFTVRHGALLPEGVAAVMRAAHIGILVSYWEGMPCFLLELLASGRPFGGLRLPQFDQVVSEGVSGRMVERGPDLATSTEAVTEAILALWDDIKRGAIDPIEVHRQIEPFSVERQLTRLFDAQRALTSIGTTATAPAALASNAKTG